MKGTHWWTGCKVLVNNTRKSLEVRVRVVWVMGLTQIVAQIGEVGGQGWDSVYSEWPRGRSCLWIWRWLTSRRMPSGQHLRNGGTHRCSSLQQLSLFVLFLSICVFIVYCTFVYLHYCTLQLSGHIGHRFPNEHDHLLRLSSHTQHSGQDSKTNGISMDCCRVEQATRMVKREETKARLQGWTTG